MLTINGRVISEDIITQIYVDNSKSILIDTIGNQTFVYKMESFTHACEECRKLIDQYSAWLEKREKIRGY